MYTSDAWVKYSVNVFQYVLNKGMSSSFFLMSTLSNPSYSSTDSSTASSTSSLFLSCCSDSSLLLSNLSEQLADCHASSSTNACWHVRKNHAHSHIPITYMYTVYNKYKLLYLIECFGQISQIYGHRHMCTHCCHIFFWQKIIKPLLFLDKLVYIGNQQSALWITLSVDQDYTVFTCSQFRFALLSVIRQLP